MRELDPDGVQSLYQYNGKGEREYTAIGPNQNDQIDFDGYGRITRTFQYATNNGSANVQRTEIYVWPTFTADSPRLVSKQEVSTDGLQAWDIRRNNGSDLTTYTSTAYDRPNRRRTVTVTAPDGTQTITVYQDGRLQSVTTTNPSGTVQLGQTIYAYDGYGRVASVTDARNGATGFGYNDADQVTSVLTPAPGDGQPAQTTGTEYDHRGRPKTITLPDQTSVVNVYWPSGELKQTSGSRTYPVGYQYDAQGRMTFMTNWTSFGAAGQRITAWTYHSQRGWLATKRYPDANGNPGSVGPDYNYYASGKLHERLWARETSPGVRLKTTYTVNVFGDVFLVGYNDNGATTGMTWGRDRLGRIAEVDRGAATTWLSYNDQDQLLGESNQGGTLAGLGVATAYDAYLRRHTLTATNGGTTLLSHTLGYDASSGRLQTVTDGTNMAAYSYIANADLVGQINFNAGRMMTTKQYDKINRLTSIGTVASGGATVSAGYAYNGANLRTNMALADGSRWAYGYDGLGQVNTGKRYWSDSTAVPGQQFEYTFDDIGNRTQAKMGGDQNGQNLRMANYAPNSLNQYNSRQVSTSVDVLGIGNTAASVGVTINNVAQSVYRRNEYFQALGSAGNSSSSPAWTPVSVTASRGGSTVQQPSSPPGHLLVPAANQSFSYDLDGNLTSDGVWNYVWDGENRLIFMDCQVVGPTAQHLVFEYDWQGRRIRKTVKDANNAVLSDTKFLYDGWNLVAELNGANQLVRSYLWGLDLSGTLQGAGGVGGLLQVYDVANGVHFVAYDGNGNVVALVRGSDGLTTTRYEYGPFGELLRATGPMAALNHLRWSSKYTDDETDLVYYGYRYYSPSLGRWLSRDPIEEEGGLNLNAFSSNDPITIVDIDGRGTSAANYTVCPSCSQIYPNGYRHCNRLSLNYDLTLPSQSGWFDRNIRQPGNMRFVDNTADILRDINAKIPRYDKEGTCCSRGYCIEAFSLSAHGEGPGVIPLSNASGNSLRKDIYHYNTAALVAADKPVSPKLLAQFIDARNFMLRLKSKMCSSATISFVICGAGGGPEGQMLQKQLEDIFGPNINVQLFTGNCGYALGYPIPWFGGRH